MSLALRAAVWRALGTVRDPELDQPVTTLGFVDCWSVDAEGVAVVRLRLPTFFCAPNFAWLMVADAHDAVAAVPGVTQADIGLRDHFAAQAINQGVAARAGFTAAFAGQAQAELDQLRETFVRKAALAGQERLARPLVEAGWTPQRLARARLADLAPSPELQRLRARRAEVGLPAHDQAPLLLHPAGEPVTADQVPLHLRRARLTAVSIEANTVTCRDLLTKRYAATSRATRDELTGSQSGG